MPEDEKKARGRPKKSTGTSQQDRAASQTSVKSKKSRKSVTPKKSDKKQRSKSKVS